MMMKCSYYTLFGLLIISNIALGASARKSYEQRRPQMMLFSDMDGKRTVSYHFEKHWDDQSILMEDGTRVGREASSITGTPGISWSFSQNFHLGLQAQWYIFDVALLPNAQYDFIRTATAKLSFGVMYKGSWLVVRPGAGAQLVYYQLLSKSSGGPNLEAVLGASTRYIDHRYLEVKTQGEAVPQRTYLDYIRTSNIFAGFNIAWSPLILRFVGGWEWSSGIESVPTGYQRANGPFAWGEIGVRF
ncbi:MAG: hypothetical protein HYV97_06000 [Bdellovibrio sp.]|nr:hypothetical protein [Bdellovibrio sp.]